MTDAFGVERISKKYAGCGCPTCKKMDVTCDKCPVCSKKMLSKALIPKMPKVPRMPTQGPRATQAQMFGRQRPTNNRTPKNWGDING